MAKTRNFLLVGMVSVVFAAAGGCSGTPDGDPVAGQRWYAMHNCGSCHGANGNDGRAVSIAPTNMGFRGFIGKLRTTDAPIMPYYPEAKLSASDAADIYAFLNQKR